MKFFITGGVGLPVLAFLILFPFAVAFVLFFMKKDSPARTAVTIAGALTELSASIYFAADNLMHKDMTMGVYYLSETHTIDMVIAAVELCLMLLVCSQAVRFRKYYIILLSLFGTIPALWLDFAGLAETTASHIKVDHLTVIMALVVGIVGSLICIYAIGYIKDYHRHHKEFKDRSGYFLSMLFYSLEP